MNLSKYKHDTAILNQNLKILEEIAAGNQSLESNEFLKLKQQTKRLRKHLGKATTRQKLAKLIKQQQKQHELKKIKRRLKKQEQITLNSTLNQSINTNEQTKEKSEDINQLSISTSSVPKETLLQRNQRLQRFKTAQKHLKKLNLIKQLHYARGHNSDETIKFAKKLAPLRIKWQNILNENQVNCEKEVTIEDEWNEVFFGVNDIPNSGDDETKAHKLQNFIQKRRIWDSYLTRNIKIGSSIPNGWVLPKADNSDVRWLKYQCS